MKLVCVESPFRGDTERNVMFADACMLDCLIRRGESPFLGHLQYPRVLDDALALHRELGIAAHCAWLRRADVVGVYQDYGITEGMEEAIKLAHRCRIDVEIRTLGPDWQTWFLSEAHATHGIFRLN